MMEELTPEKYREQTLKKIEEIRNVISENYITFWNVAKKLYELEDEGTRITTPFGDFTIFVKRNK